MAELFTMESLRTLLLFIPVLILSLSFHEYAHAWAAARLGDQTARYLGRLTMDPTAHISVIGTIVFPAIAVLTGAPLFGWANPVPVDSRNFKKPQIGMAYVAAAGPISNILFAIVLTVVLSFIGHSQNAPVQIIKAQGGMLGAGVEMSMLAIQLNLFLAFFNLVPIPPLDGWRILMGFVSGRTALSMEKFESMGSWILLALVFTGALRILAVPVYIFMGLMFHVLQVPY